jgi:hypothetical protein
METGHSHCLAFATGRPARRPFASLKRIQALEYLRVASGRDSKLANIFIAPLAAHNGRQACPSLVPKFRYPQRTESGAVYPKTAGALAMRKILYSGEEKFSAVVVLKYADLGIIQPVNFWPCRTTSVELTPIIACGANTVVPSQL